MTRIQLAGTSSPLGATVADGGINFSLFSRTATGIELLFFDREDDGTPSRVVRLDVEGPTDDQAVEQLRNRQVKNYLTVTVMSLGVPMILMGDEVRHTQGGNNTGYCQDNDFSWFDWTRLEKHADVLRFVRLLTARRLRRDIEHERRRFTLTTLIDEADKAWHGLKPYQPDWGDDSHSLAFGTELRNEGLHIHWIMNAYLGPLEFELPRLEAETWRRWIDTALASPDDIVRWEQAPPVTGATYLVGERSVVLLYAHIRKRPPE
jgi:glycogen operon protein